jgi:hypothetical protein
MNTSEAPQPAGRWVSVACASKSCGAPIVWARTRTGSRMPVDASPDSDGGKYRLVDDGGPEPRAIYGPQDPATIAALLAGDLVELHTSHFATCPQARAFRRTRSSR